MRRVLDKFTGSQYAAKFIFVCDEHQKRFFRTELNILRWLNQRGVPKVVDAFVTERRIVIITEMYPWFDLFTSSQRYFDYNTYSTYILSKLLWLPNILLFLKDKLGIYYIVVRSCICNKFISLLIKLTVKDSLMHIIGLDFCPQSDRIWHHRQPSSEPHTHRKYGSFLYKATPSCNQGTPQSLCVALRHQGISYSACSCASV